jgi:hypothetical protein
VRRLVLLLTACGGVAPSGSPPADVGAPPRVVDAAVPIAVAQKTAYEVVPVDKAGTVLGLVTTAKLPPAAATAPVAGPAGCPGSVAVPPVTMAANGGVVGALVWLDVTKGKAPAPAVGELAVDRCVLAPRAVLAAPGLAVRNDDDVRHEVAIAREGQELARWPLPLEGSRYQMELGEAGVYEVSGDGGAHALVVVPPHPYHAVTDADGRYRLDGVPPGTYTVHVWHPGLGGQPALSASGQVTVVADEAVEAPLALAP